MDSYLTNLSITTAFITKSTDQDLKLSIFPSTFFVVVKIHCTLLAHHKKKKQTRQQNLDIFVCVCIIYSLIFWRELSCIYLLLRNKQQPKYHEHSILKLLTLPLPQILHHHHCHHLTTLPIFLPSSSQASSWLTWLIFIERLPCAKHIQFYLFIHSILITSLPGWHLCFI